MSNAQYMHHNNNVTVINGFDCLQSATERSVANYVSLIGVYSHMYLRYLDQMFTTGIQEVGAYRLGRETRPSRHAPRALICTVPDNLAHHNLPTVRDTSFKLGMT